MKKIYKRIKVNKELLKLGANPNKDLMQNEVSDTLPTGKVIGVYFLSYASIDLTNIRPIGDTGLSMKAPDFILHTDIVMKDSRGHLLTEPTDLRDYAHKAGGYNQGFKELDFMSQNERVTIAWETIGSTPICGEFIFEIEAPTTC